MLSSVAEFNGLKSTLNASGITYTTPEPMPTIPRPTTTAADVAQAILASKKTNPYSDPAVQTALAEYNVSTLGEITASQATLRDQNTLAHARAQLPGMLEQAEVQFEQTAQELKDAHATLGNTQDLSTIDLNTAAPHIAEAALKAIRAIAKMDAITTVWKRVHRMHNNTGCTNVADVYMRGNPSIKLLLQYRKDQRQLTVWNQVLDGVKFSLATPTEAQERYMHAQQEHERDKRPHVSYLR